MLGAVCLKEKSPKTISAGGWCYISRRVWLWLWRVSERETIVWKFSALWRFSMSVIFLEVNCSIKKDGINSGRENTETCWRFWCVYCIRSKLFPWASIYKACILVVFLWHSLFNSKLYCVAGGISSRESLENFVYSIAEGQWRPESYHCADYKKRII